MGYGSWWDRNYDNEVWQITHWMPLPEDPQIINVKGDIMESIEKIVNLLEKFGIQVKTANGDYRPTYDVLLDIGKVVFGKEN